MLAFVGVPSINNHTIEADLLFVIGLSLSQLKIVNLSAFVKGLFHLVNVRSRTSLIDLHFFENNILSAI